MRIWIRRLLAAPVFEDEEKTRAARLLNTTLLVLLVATVLTVIAIPVLVGLPNDLYNLFTWLAGGVLVVTVAGLLLLARRGHVRTASLILLSLLWLVTTAWVCGIAGIASDSSLLQYALIIVLGGLLLGGRGAIGLTLFSLLAIAVAYFAEVTGLLPPPPSGPATEMDLLLTVVPIALTGLMLRYAVNSLIQALRRARKNELAQTEANRELQAIRASLEQRVTDRTRDLERRAAQLQAANVVDRTVTSILETDQLVHQVVELIRMQFGLYYVGLFLVDEAGEWAILQAATGEAGQTLLARGYRVKVGEGLIGQSVARGQVRVASAASEDTTRAAAPELPDTRSEAALPLRSRGRVLGALSVASEQPDAFDASAIAVLETVADQVAVALDNTRLFTESQAALEAARRAYGEQSRQAWAELLRPRAGRGYRYAHQAVVPLAGDWQPEMSRAAQTGQRVLGESAGEPAAAIPLKVRDEVVGVLGFYKDTAGETWTAEETTLLETLADQLSTALESARLYQDAQSLAARERLLGDVTARVRETLDVDMVLKTAVQEARQALGLPEVVIRLVSPVLAAPADNGSHGKEGRS